MCIPPVRNLPASGRGREVVASGYRMFNVRPSRRDYFCACIEGHSFWTVNVLVAEKRVLPAAERVVGHRDGNGHVDAHHADLAAALEPSRRLHARGEDGGAV